MKLKQPLIEMAAGRERKTPGFVWAALCVNLLLLLAGFILPRRIAVDSADGAMAATSLFAIAMGLILVIGFATVIRAYILARGANGRMPIAAFLPGSLFIVGLAGALVLTFGKSV